jgi:phenylacetate-CoA ligase
MARVVADGGQQQCVARQRRCRRPIQAEPILDRRAEPGIDESRDHHNLFQTDRPLMSKFDSIYARLPVWGQHSAVTAYGLYWSWLRFGPGYRTYVKEFRQRDTFTSEQWQAWQQEALRRQLCEAVKHVPYYRDTWSSSEQQAALAGQLQELPFLEKQPLRDHPRSLLREDLRTRHESVSKTSGTTGTPITNYWTWPEVRKRIALREARSANWAGVSFKMPRVTFSGRIVVPDVNSSGPFHRFNAVERQTYFSAFHLKPSAAQSYVDALWKHRPIWMTGYAVSYYLLAKFVLEQQLAVPDSLRAIITTSEKLTEQMRATMTAAFGCRVFEEYSTVESAVFASECEQGRLHVSPDVAIVEILRPDGSPCDYGEEGEVVATNLMRQYQPFIRYRLGDMAKWDDEPCPCGRQMPVIKEVVGRIEDVVIGIDGRRMVRFHGIFVDQPHVREGQIIQESLQQIRARVVPSEGFGDEDADDIIARIRQRLGPEVNVAVEIVKEIPRTPAGKTQAVINLMRNRGVAEAERTGLNT